MATPDSQSIKIHAWNEFLHFDFNSKELVSAFISKRIPAPFV